MAAHAPARRALIAGLAALGAAAPRISLGEIMEVGGNASRLVDIPSPQAAADGSHYQPPTRISAVMDIYKRMTTPVKVAGAGPYQFVADTGANQSVISTEVAVKLGLLLGPALPLNGVAGVQLTPTTQASVEIGPRPKRQATLSVLPQAAIGAPGMLGLDLLDGAQLTLDFSRQTLTIDNDAGRSGMNDEIHLKAHRRDGQLTLVDADLAGIRVTAFLDSGAQDTIGNMALRDLAVTRYPLIPFRPIPIVSVTGPDHRRPVRRPAGPAHRRPDGAELAGRLRRPAHLPHVGPGQPAGRADRRRYPQPLRNRLPRFPPRRSPPAPADAGLSRYSSSRPFMCSTASRNSALKSCTTWPAPRTWSTRPTPWPTK